MLLFELKKSYFKKSIIILILIFTAANVWKCSDLKQNHSRFSYMESVESAYRELVGEKLSGPITTEKIQFVMEQYQDLAYLVDRTDYSREFDEERYTGYVFGDYGLFRFYIIPDMEYAYLYPQFSAQITARAAENEAFYAGIGNSYQMRENALIKGLYQNRSVPAFYDTEGITEFLSYDFSALLSILMVLLPVSGCFSSEKETGIYTILSPTTNRKKWIRSKIFAALLYSQCIGVYFFALDLLSFHAIWGIHGMGNPLYSLSDFQYTPFGGSILSFVLLRLCVRLLFLAALCVICLLCSSSFRSNRMAFGLASLLAVGCIILQELYPNVPYNPAVLLQSGMVQTFQTIHLGPYPVLTFYAAVGAAFLYIVVLSFLLWRRVRKW